MSDEQRNRVIQEWMTAADAAKKWADRERQLRDYIVAQAFPGAADGTHRLELGNGYALKVVKSTRWDVDAARIDSVLDVVRKLPDGYTIADAVIRWKPALALTEFRAISLDAQKLFEPALTTKPNAPQLSVEEPKRR